MKKILSALIVLVSLMSFVVVMPASAAGEVNVTINAPAQVLSGSVFTASVDITNVTDFDATNYDVSFNPDVLRLDDVTDGNIGGTTIPVEATNNWTRGTYTIVQNVPALIGVNGTGYLAVLHFYVIGSAGQSSNIALSEGVLGNNLANAIPSVWTGDTVNVVGAVTQLQSIAVTPDGPLAIPAGLTQQFSANGTFKDTSGNVTYQNITGGAVWHSSNDAVAGFGSPSGNLTTHLPGTVGIWATSANSSGQVISNNVTVNVGSPALLSVVVSPATASVPAGLTKQFSANGTFTDGSNVNIAANWTSSNSAVATVNNAGLATSKAQGTAIITANQSGKLGTATLTVNVADVVSVKITPVNPTIPLSNNTMNSTLQFTATANYTDGITHDVTSSAMWMSDNHAVATINATGGALAYLVEGVARIMADYNDPNDNNPTVVFDSTNLTVKATQLQSIAVTPSNSTIVFGSTQRFNATGTYINASTANITGSVAWTSSNTSVATVNATTGLATAVAAGTTNITATSGNVSGYAVLRVKAGNSNLVILPAVQTVNVNGTFTADVQVQTNGDAINVVSFYLDFDPAMLAVKSVAAMTTWNGYAVSQTEKTFDNVTGKVNFTSGNPQDELGNAAPVSGTFNVATINFYAKAPTANTSINFHFYPPANRATDVYHGAGESCLDTTTGASVAISSGVSVNISTVLQGGTGRPDAGWVVPLTVKFFPQNTVDVLNDTAGYTFTQTTAKSGSTAVTQVTGITPGTYDITVKSAHTLVNVKRSVVISQGVTVNMGTLLDGNAREDGLSANIISGADFSFMSNYWGKLVGDALYSAQADFNLDGVIGGADFSILSNNWNKESPNTVQ